MILNQQEQEVVDAFEDSPTQIMTAAELCRELRWGTAKLLPILAELIEKRVIVSSTGSRYPYSTVYCLR